MTPPAAEGVLSLSSAYWAKGAAPIVLKAAGVVTDSTGDVIEEVVKEGAAAAEMVVEAEEEVVAEVEAEVVGAGLEGSCPEPPGR